MSPPEIAGTSAGVDSFNGRTGSVVPLQADYDGFFLTQAEADARYPQLLGALTAGRVAIVGAGGKISDDAGLVYDAATDTLTTPTVIGSTAVAAGAVTAVSQFTDGVFLRGVNGFIQVVRGGAAALVFGTGDTADNQHAFIIDNDGQLQWGPGNAGRDVNLYRRAANQLGTDDNVFINAPVGGVGLDIRQAGDADGRWRANANGTLVWGDAAGAFDTNLYRSAADTLKTDDKLQVASTVTAHIGATGQVTIGDIGTNTGGISWGASPAMRLIRIGSGDTLLLNDAADATGVYLRHKLRGADIGNANMGNQEMCFFVDEAANAVKLRYRTAAGVAKIATIGYVNG